MATAGKKYGLIISQKDKHVPKKVNIFDDDSDDETGKTEVNTAIQREAFRTKVKKQTQLEIDKALSEDPSVYEYDQVYDDMQSLKAAKKQERTTGDGPKKPKYIHNLLKFAENRKKEEERRTERKVQKEREAEGDEFRDKEAFVTSAYKKKMEEMQTAEEVERRQAQMEEMLDVTKQKDLGGFYRNLLNETTRNTAADTTDSKTEINKDDEQRAKPRTDSEDSRSNSESMESPEKVSQKKSKSNRITRHDRKRSYSRSSDESSASKSKAASTRRSSSSSRSSSGSRAGSRGKRRRPDRSSDAREWDRRRSRSREKKTNSRRSVEKAKHRSRERQKRSDRSRSGEKRKRRSRSNNRNDCKSREKQGYRSRSGSKSKESERQISRSGKGTRHRSRSQERKRQRSRSKERARQRSRSGEHKSQSSRMSSREEEKQKSSQTTLLNDRKMSSLESEDRENRDKLKNVDKETVLTKQESTMQKYARHTTAGEVQDARARYLARKLERSGTVGPAAPDNA